jgi:hypothetical protein
MSSLVLNEVFNFVKKNRVVQNVFKVRLGEEVKDWSHERSFGLRSMLGMPSQKPISKMDQYMGDNRAQINAWQRENQIMMTGQEQEKQKSLQELRKSSEEDGKKLRMVYQPGFKAQGAMEKRLIPDYRASKPDSMESKMTHGSPLLKLKTTVHKTKNSLPNSSTNGLPQKRGPRNWERANSHSSSSPEILSRKPRHSFFIFGAAGVQKQVMRILEDEFSP